MTFDETKHHRAPKGTREGGQFTEGEWHDINEDDFEELGDLSEDELNEMRDETIYRPSGSEIDAVSAYCDRSYEEINAALRAGEDVGDGAGIVDEMDALFTKSELKQNIATFRDVSRDFAETLKTLKAGDRLKDDGFLSSSTNPDIEMRWGSGVKMKILVKKGTPAIIPASWSHVSDEEDEVILPRGGALRYLGRSGANHLVLYEQAD